MVILLLKSPPSLYSEVKYLLSHNYGQYKTNKNWYDKYRHYFYQGYVFIFTLRFFALFYFSQSPTTLTTYFQYDKLTYLLYTMGFTSRLLYGTIPVFCPAFAVFYYL